MLCGATIASHATSLIFVLLLCNELAENHECNL